MMFRILVVVTAVGLVAACATQDSRESHPKGTSDSRVGGDAGVTVGTGPTYLQRTQAMDAQRQRSDQWNRANP